ncbi:MAG TPA: hypothetical protein PK653_00060 [Syntrophales bacterium]|nr:hypothetical protein [Syntrophales bacterium]
MKIRSAVEMVNKGGKFIVIYGETGVGKTASTLASAPLPIAYVRCEPRDPSDAIMAAKLDPRDIDIYDADNFLDLLAGLRDPKLFARHRTIFVDGASYLMNVSLSTEIEQEAFEAREEKEKRLKPLVSQSKMSQEGFGGLSSQMSRMFNLLGKLSMEGKVVIVSALLAENPKWDRELSAAPAFKGREFPTNMPAFVDMIGLVQKRFDEHGNIVYPPFVSFEGDGSFICKFTGVKNDPNKKAVGPLDFSRILRMERKGGEQTT